MEIILEFLRKLVVENADYEGEIERLSDNLLTAYADGRASRDDEVDTLGAELAALKMSAAAKRGSTRHAVMPGKRSPSDGRPKGRPLAFSHVTLTAVRA
jgi:hypothetical protein